MLGDLGDFRGVFDSSAGSSALEDFLEFLGDDLGDEFFLEFLRLLRLARFSRFGVATTQVGML